MFFGAMVLLLMLSLAACVCANELERWINELMAQLIEDMEQALRDWWNGLVEDIKQDIADWWGDIQQGWRDFWASIFPPTPTITVPTDGTVASSQTISV